VHPLVLSDYTRISPICKSLFLTAARRATPPHLSPDWRSNLKIQCYYSLMGVSGFVLAGGRSVRMGRDKALLPFRGATLLEYVAGVLSEALGPRAVAIVGNPERYCDFGYPVHPDRVIDCGPLGGIYTALTVSGTDWNLVAACDMPNLASAGVKALLDRAATSEANCVLASGASGKVEPLYGAYHRRCLPVVSRAILDKRFKMMDLLPELGAETQIVTAEVLANVNTPAEWAEFQGQPG
jgi:molybdenum cofactor guanylyltransferase